MLLIVVLWSISLVTDYLAINILIFADAIHVVLLIPTDFENISINHIVLSVLFMSDCYWSSLSLMLLFVTYSYWFYSSCPNWSCNVVCCLILCEWLLRIIFIFFYWSSLHDVSRSSYCKGLYSHEQGPIFSYKLPYIVTCTIIRLPVQ